MSELSHSILDPGTVVLLNEAMRNLPLLVGVKHNGRRWLYLPLLVEMDS